LDSPLFPVQSNCFFRKAKNGLQTIKNRRFVGSDIVVDIPPTILLHESSGFSGSFIFTLNKGFGSCAQRTCSCVLYKTVQCPLDSPLSASLIFPVLLPAVPFAGAVSAAPPFFRHPPITV